MNVKQNKTKRQQDNDTIILPIMTVRFLVDITEHCANSKVMSTGVDNKIGPRVTTCLALSAFSFFTALPFSINLPPKNSRKYGS